MTLPDVQSRLFSLIRVCRDLSEVAPHVEGT